MLVQDIMTKDVRTIMPDKSIVDAAKLMRDLDVGSVPVTNGAQEIIGIITDRDIVLRSIAAQQDPGSTRIEDLMSGDIFSVAPSDDVTEAAEIMARERIRRLPVVEYNKIVGMVSLGDLAAKDVEEAAVRSPGRRFKTDRAEELTVHMYWNSRNK